jgi:hypothetical protein
MKLTLIRSPSATGWTLGRLAIDGRPECYTCEDVVREAKIPGETAIPAGVYKVIITLSNRFKRPLPLIFNSSDGNQRFVQRDGMRFDGVRIHPGNTAADTEGCILPGRGFNVGGVTESRVAFEALHARIDAALLMGEAVTLEIRNAPAVSG